MIKEKRFLLLKTVGNDRLIYITSIAADSRIEAMEGFPDDWTRWGNYNGEVKEIARTNRYKMIGNSVTVDVVAAVAKRLRFEC